jgi:hypothetical protein
MMGSGTTVVEGYLASCLAIGVDIDPLAKLITEVKTSALDAELLREVGNGVVRDAAAAVEQRRDWLAAQLAVRWDARTRDFVDYWFARETQLELLALVTAIAAVPDERVRAFFQLALSACIITKSGGVSLAFDLAHTRPHRAKVAYSPAGELVVGAERQEDSSPRTQLLTKRVKSALGEFRKRVQQNIGSLAEIPHGLAPAQVHLGDAQRLPVGNAQVDLIVTSPPYAVNAIDYMRANKFSLVWLGYTLDELAQTRKDCIGGENTAAFTFEELPAHTAKLVGEISTLDAKRGRALHRYYSEMARILREMYRVLKPDRAAIVVVASSAIRDRDTETDKCLGEIGCALGFELAGVGIRQLDRNRRMLPAGHRIDGESQIQKRMHEEFVIGFYKPRG